MTEVSTELIRLRNQVQQTQVVQPADIMAVVQEYIRNTVAGNTELSRYIMDNRTPIEVQQIQTQLHTMQDNITDTVLEKHNEQASQIEMLEKQVADLTNIIKSLPSKDYVQTFVEQYTQGTLPMKTITANSSIFGYVPINMDSLLSKFHNAQTHYTLFDWRSIFTDYDNFCREVNVNPYVLIAQGIHESGWASNFWSARPQRNWFSYGVTGRVETQEPKTTDVSHWVKVDSTWHEGFSFASWSEAIKVHIGHMLAYALTTKEANEKQKEYIALSPRARLVKRGSAATLAGLDGQYNEKPTGYPTKIANIANILMS